MRLCSQFLKIGTNSAPVAWRPLQVHLPLDDLHGKALLPQPLPRDPKRKELRLFRLVITGLPEGSNGNDDEHTLVKPRDAALRGWLLGCGPAPLPAPLTPIIVPLSVPIRSLRYQMIDSRLARGASQAQCCK